ncbi:MAG: ABC transporter permease, partial [Rhodobacterales bacterium]|nr:ABC transporter permease [Rhodobacterales bacterium]
MNSFFLFSIVFWVAAWTLNIFISQSNLVKTKMVVPPILFGVSLLLIWEASISAFEVSPVILPAPSLVFIKFINSVSILWVDFVQTFVKGALSGYIFGCSAAFGVALLADRFKFLERGLLPIGTFMAALPIVGTAPILVRWFGFDWESKSAVVTV